MTFLAGFKSSPSERKRLASMSDEDFLKTDSTSFSDQTRIQMGKGYDPKVKAKNMQALRDMSPKDLQRCYGKMPEKAQDRLVEYLEQVAPQLGIDSPEGIQFDDFSANLLAKAKELLAEVVEVVPQHFASAGVVIGSAKREIPLEHMKILKLYGVSLSDIKR